MTSNILLERGRVVLEDVVLMPCEFEQHLYELRQFLSFVYTIIDEERPDYNNAILCLNLALEGNYPLENPAFAAETLKLRGSYYARCNNPALSIEDCREAIDKYNQLMGSPE